VTRDRPIGIDIEYVDRFLMAEHRGAFLCAREIARLSALPSDVQLEAFFAC
jgi:hypothetical protein